MSQPTRIALTNQQRFTIDKAIGILKTVAELHDNGERLVLDPYESEAGLLKDLVKAGKMVADVMGQRLDTLTRDN